MDLKTRKSFFSVSFDLILLEENLPYDLYINSSTHAKREKFIRIFPMNGRLSQEDLNTFKEKYYQLYVLENQRDLYLKSLTELKGASEVKKTEVIKGSAIAYLENVFDSTREFTTELLNEAVEGCRDSVESMIDVIQDYDVSEVQGLIAKLSFHDFYTYDHSVNVAMYSISILKALKPKAKKIDMVMAGLGGLLHDLGKIRIPTSIINNPGKLSEEDFTLIKEHPGHGNDLMSEHELDMDDVDFEVIKRVIYEHHENYNGTGYPNKLKGSDIHILARVTAIADFFDAITTKRSYHEVLSTEDALEVMGHSVGRKIDPKIFDIFSKNVGSILKGKKNQELSDDFDPCQPTDILPFQKPSAKVQRSDFLKKEESDFGRVSTQKKKKKVA